MEEFKNAHEENEKYIQEIMSETGISYDKAESMLEYLIVTGLDGYAQKGGFGSFLHLINTK